MTLRILVALLFAMMAAGVRADRALPADSVYHLDVALTDQAARATTFAAGRGAVRIVSMFYANCPYVCPMIVETIKRTERELPEDQRARLSVLLVTLDPARDDPAALAKVAAQRQLDATRWTLARTADAEVRKLAALLGIQYRQLENREFNHSSALILLDADGRVLARSSKLGETDPDFVAALRAALARADRRGPPCPAADCRAAAARPLSARLPSRARARAAGRAAATAAAARGSIR